MMDIISYVELLMLLTIQILHIMQLMNVIFITRST
jgi:hypothetical protein